MELLPIHLSVKRKAHRKDSPNAPASDAAYRAARPQALKRDDYCCRFCGFKDKKNETHHVNDDHNDQRLENLVTSCVLCHMCHHIAFAGIQGRASLIYLAPNADGSPVISQAGLNNLVRNLWIAEETATGDIRNTAGQLLARLEKCDTPAVHILGTSFPEVIGDVMTSLSDAAYSKRGDALNGVFLLPKKKAYLPYIKELVESSKKFPPTEWVRLAEDKIAQWPEAS